MEKMISGIEPLMFSGVLLLPFRTLIGMMGAMHTKPIRTVLKNGMRVILLPEPQSLATTVMVLVEAGSKYETKAINGISHFLEHMCFKGTTKRPRAADIAWELDGLGAEYNAFTGQELTSYFAKARNEALEKILEIVADLYVNPQFDPNEIEKEKGVIVEEINMYEDLPPRKVQELFLELVYGDQPAGWNIAGSKETVRSITRDNFLKYRGEHYVPQATAVVVAGGFSDAERVLRLVEEQFGTLSAGAKSPKVGVIEKQEKPGELVFAKESDQTHLVLGFRAFDVFDERRFALELLADILGGSMGSRLFQKIREEMGAAYYVHAATDLYSDHGLIAMSAGVDHLKMRDVISAGLGEFARFRNETVTPEELERAKEHAIGSLILSLETSDQLGYFFGFQEALHMALRTPEEVADRIRAVRAEDIQALAWELFKNDRLNLAVIGPFRGVSFNDIVRIE